MFLSKQIINYYNKLTEERLKKFVSSFNPNPEKCLLSLGCANGTLATRVAKKIQTNRIYGIELHKPSYKEANRKFNVIVSDLNDRFPLENNNIDIVCSDQVIEHLWNVDSFVEEIYRVLAPGGYAVISTENLSAWHNLFALLLGCQAFSQTISAKYYMGNRLSPHYKQERDGSAGRLWTHIQIFTLKGLKDLFSVNGFEIIDSWGSGYLPLPLTIGKLFERIDPVHSYFIGIKVRKPAQS